MKNPVPSPSPQGSPAIPRPGDDGPLLRGGAGAGSAGVEAAAGRLQCEPAGGGTSAEIGVI